MRYAWLVVLAACGGGSSSLTDASGAEVPGVDACTPHTIFLNRGGGVYTKGAADDARTNTSSVIDMNRTIAPVTGQDADWTTIKDCVTAKLTPFGIAVTDVDPGQALHTEVVLLNNGTQIGAPGLTSGAAATPCAGGFATASRQAIAFAAMLGSAANRCWDISMAIGYTLGLDNVQECADVMSLASACSITGKLFTATDQTCGQTAPGACRCGGTTQNAAARIAANIPTCP